MGTTIIVTDLPGNAELSFGRVRNVPLRLQVVA